MIQDKKQIKKEEKNEMTYLLNGKGQPEIE